jgi:hypothetical protein
MVNGFDSLIMTKLDVLDELDEIPVCVAYKLDGKTIEKCRLVTPIWTCRARSGEYPWLETAHARYLSIRRPALIGAVLPGVSWNADGG